LSASNSFFLPSSATPVSFRTATDPAFPLATSRSALTTLSSNRPTSTAWDARRTRSPSSADFAIPLNLAISPSDATVLVRSASSEATRNPSISLFFFSRTASTPSFPTRVYSSSTSARRAAPSTLTPSTSFLYSTCAARSLACIPATDSCNVSS